MKKRNSYEVSAGVWEGNGRSECEALSLSWVEERHLIFLFKLIFTQV